jgi:multisubunit Na+/H+ antiporter MnhB subunit
MIEVEKFIYGTFAEVIVGPLLVLLTTIAFVFFFMGIVKMTMNAGKEEGRIQGRNHIIWSLVGLFVIFSVSNILVFLKNTSDSFLK